LSVELKTKSLGGNTTLRSTHPTFLPAVACDEEPDPDPAEPAAEVDTSESYKYNHNKV